MTEVYLHGLEKPEVFTTMNLKQIKVKLDRQISAGLTY
jgi:hypothetical protein